MSSQRIAACGQCAPMLWAEGKINAAVRLERLRDDVAKQHELDILCAYPASDLPAGEDGLQQRYLCSALSPAWQHANDALPAWPRGCCAPHSTDHPSNDREWHDLRLPQVFRGWRRHRRSGLGSAPERWHAASGGSAAAIADAAPAPVSALRALEQAAINRFVRHAQTLVVRVLGGRKFPSSRVFQQT